MGLISPGLRLPGRGRPPTGGKAKPEQWAEGSCCHRGAPALAAAEGSTGHCEQWIKEEEVENVKELLWDSGFSDPSLNLIVSIP